jgi:hypothetical protein
MRPRLAAGAISKQGFFVHHSGIPGNPVDLRLGVIKMRKVALLAAVIVAAAFSSTSNVAVAQGQDLNPNTTKFVRDAVNPYAATAKPAAPAMHKKHKKHKTAKK